MGAVPFLLAIGALPALAQTLPAYCGAVGASSYTPPAVTIPAVVLNRGGPESETGAVSGPAVTIPAVVLNRGTAITVTNTSMLINGDTSSVKALVANPGPDGISIQEAITATNNDPGTWNIQFAPALKGSMIAVDSGGQGALGLSGGNVTINGDIDGDGQPDIALTSMSGTLTVSVSSGGNTLNGLALQGCAMLGCVFLDSGGSGPTVATGKTFANTTISNLVMTNIPTQGSGIRICPNCGPVTSPTGNTWDHVLITGNTITGDASGPGNGIQVQIIWGSTLQHTTIANNHIVLAAQGALGISFITGDGLGPPDQGSDILLDTRVIDNTITAPQGIVFRGTAVGSLYDGVQVIGNQITSMGAGITFLDADVELGLATPAPQWNNNIMRNIALLANTIQVSGVGIQVFPAQNAAANNAISNLSILGNTILNTARAPTSPVTGISLHAASSGGSVSVASGNSLSNVLIQANSIQNSIPPGNVNSGGGDVFYPINAGGISVYGGINAQGNGINGISIANNDVNTPNVGIAITAGYGGGAPVDGGPTFSADHNVVAGAQIFCNQLDQIPTNGVTPASGIKGINVTAGLDLASGNQVQQLLVVDNLVAGVLGGFSIFPDLGSGGSGNTVSMAQVSTPWPQFMPAGLFNAATFQQDALAPGSLVSLFGNNLNGATVQFDGIPAFVFYNSSSQLNLQVPWELEGKSSTAVTVTANSITSAPQAVAVGPADPGIFSLGAPQGGQGAIVTLAGIVVDANSPAHAGDYLEIYANGLGPVNSPPQSGAVAISSPPSKLIGNLVATIGGVPASVVFAGLAPGYIGLYQVNVQVPQGVAAGDAVPVMLSTGAMASNTVIISVR